MIRAVLSVATWNLKFNSAPLRTLSYLQHARWDIACLPEVSGSASTLLEQRENWTVVDGLKLASPGARLLEATARNRDRCPQRMALRGLRSGCRHPNAGTWRRGTRPAR
jgi:hypothetical protein